jgi:hypothetical protein
VGTFVGNGPSVSVGATTQPLKLLPVLLTEPEFRVVDESDFLHALNRLGPVATPTSRLFKNIFFPLGFHQLIKTAGKLDPQDEETMKYRFY